MLDNTELFKCSIKSEGNCTYERSTLKKQWIPHINDKREVFPFIWLLKIMPYIYFVQGEETQKIKIGVTKRVIEVRLKRLQTGSPDILRFIGGCVGDRRYEHELHCRFKEYKSHGEWFFPDKTIIEFIKHECFSDPWALYEAVDEVTLGNIKADEVIQIGEEEFRARHVKKLGDMVRNVY